MSDSLVSRGTRTLNLANLSEVDRLVVDSIIDMDNILGRIDYPFFVHTVLGHNFPEIKDPTVQKRLKQVGEIFKDWLLTRHTQEHFRKVMFCHPRGSCKSSGSTIPFAPFAHLSDTEIACMIMSATYEGMALKFTEAARQVWSAESPDSRLVDLYGQFKPVNARTRPWSKDKMVSEKRQGLSQADPTLAGFSVGHGATSGHFDVGVLDDLVTSEAMERDMNHLDKSWEAYLRMHNVLNNDALLLYSFTRYDDGDPCGRIIREEIEPKVRELHEGFLPDDWDEDTGWIKYAHLAGWEVFYDTVYEDYDPVTKTGKVVYPDIWPHSRIENVRATTRGEAMFWSQLMNKPAAREDAPITRKQVESAFIETIQDVPKAALRTIDLHCDFSFKDSDAYFKQRGDWGVVHVVAKDGGYVYRIGGYRGKDTQKRFGEMLMQLMGMVYYDLGSKVRYITYEQSMGHGSGDESTRMWLHQCFMTNTDIPRATPYPIRRSKQGNKTKLQRIMDMNWAWQEGYVRLVREAPGNDPLVYQMLNQGYSQYDDDADAFADVFHEGIYKKTRAGDLPDAVSKYMGGSNWTPLPTVHGSIDRHGNFQPERRTSRNPGAQRPNLFGDLLGRNK